MKSKPTIVPMEEPPVSLCSTCAKHPSLCEFVQSDHEKGLCGVCGKSDVEVFNPSRPDELSARIKALCRFYFDESEYNSHWGGSSIQELICEDDNPIIHANGPHELNDQFGELVEGQPYPDYGSGIGLYAGHDPQVGRLIQRSIQNQFPSRLSEIISRLHSENFYAVEPEVAKLCESFSKELEDEVKEGEVWFRARRGIAKRYQVTDPDGWEAKIVAHPYTANEIGALPPPRASAGRMNRQGVSVLYLAQDKETAICEIRPDPSDQVSSGSFKAKRRLRIANFDCDIASFSSSDERLELFAYIFHLNRLMSTPVIRDEKHRYSVTQILSEVLISNGFDAVIFQSSVANGRNLCAFNPADFEFVDGFSEVTVVREVRYDTFEVPSTTSPSANHWEIK
jgi:hypothetical protein